METKICKLCGKVFIPHHFNQKICDDTHYKPCPVCGKPVEWVGYERCCSTECTVKKRKSTCLEKYGYESAQKNPEIQAKSRETTLKHFGVEYPSQNKDVHDKQLDAYLSHYGKKENPDGRKKLEDKRKETCRQKYGVDYVFQCEDFRKHAEESSIEKYGVKNPMQNAEIRKRREATVYERYGVKNVMQNTEVCNRNKATVRKKYGYDNVLSSPDVRKKISDTVQTKYGVPWYCMTEECKKANGHIISKLNMKFAKLLDSRNITYEQEYRINSYSYDFLLTDYDVLVEIDPTITHTNLFNMFDKSEKGLDKYYHINKTKLAENDGFKCIHIFDWDDWDTILNSVINHSESKHTIGCNLVCKGDEDDSIIIQRCLNDRCVQFLQFEYKCDDEWVLNYSYENNIDNDILGYKEIFSYFCDTYRPNKLVFYEDRSKYPIHLPYFYVDIEPQKIWSKDTDMIYDSDLKKFLSEDSLEDCMVKNYWYSLYDCGYREYQIL